MGLHHVWIANGRKVRNHATNRGVSHGGCGGELYDRSNKKEKDPVMHGSATLSEPNAQQYGPSAPTQARSIWGWQLHLKNE